MLDQEYGTVRGGFRSFSCSDDSALRVILNTRARDTCGAGILRTQIVPCQVYPARQRIWTFQIAQGMKSHANVLNGEIQRICPAQGIPGGPNGGSGMIERNLELSEVHSGLQYIRSIEIRNTGAWGNVWSKIFDCQLRCTPFCSALVYFLECSV